MHAGQECKAPTRCRNCGGPHRSDYRKCLARLSGTSPESKEQLSIIRQCEQQEYAAVVRARAAAERAEVASDAASKDVPWRKEQALESWTRKRRYRKPATQDRRQRILRLYGNNAGDELSSDVTCRSVSCLMRGQKQCGLEDLGEKETDEKYGIRTNLISSFIWCLRWN